MCAQVWPMAEKAEKYSVRRISGRKQVRGRTYYLIEWKGFGVDDDSWEPDHNILDETLVSDFLAALAPPMTPDWRVRVRRVRTRALNRCSKPMYAGTIAVLPKCPPQAY